MWDNDSQKIASFIFRLFYRLLSIIVNIFIQIINLVRICILRIRIARTNNQRRGVTEITSCSILECVNNYLFDGNLVVIIQKNLRLKIMSEYMVTCNNRGSAVVCICNHGNEYEQLLSLRSKNCYSPQTNGFDPFFGLSDDLLCDSIINCTYEAKSLRLSHIAYMYMQGVLLYMHAKGVQILFNNIYLCISPYKFNKYRTLIDWVQDDLNNKLLPHDTADQILHYLYSGQNELSKLQEVFDILKSDIGQYCKGSNRTTIANVLDKRQIFLFDASRMNPEITVSLLVSILSLLEKKMLHHTTFVVDSFRFVSCSELTKYIHSHLPNGNVVISGESINSMIAGQESEWKSIVGSTTTMLVGRQSGSDMAKLISEFFGTYEKIVQNIGLNSGASNNPAALLSGVVHQGSQESYQEATKPKISIDDLQHMKDDEVIVSNSRVSIIDLLRISDADASAIV